MHTCTGKKRIKGKIEFSIDFSDCVLVATVIMYTLSKRLVVDNFVPWNTIWNNCKYIINACAYLGIYTKPHDRTCNLPPGVKQGNNRTRVGRNRVFAVFPLFIGRFFCRVKKTYWYINKIASAEYQLDTIRYRKPYRGRTKYSGGKCVYRRIIL